MQFRGFGVLRSGGYFVLFHASIRGCPIGPDAAGIEIQSLFSGLFFLVWIVGLENFQAQLSRFSLSFLFMLYLVYNSSHIMHVLMQFVLLCQMLSDLMTGYS